MKKIQECHTCDPTDNTVPLPGIINALSINSSSNLAAIVNKTLSYAYGLADDPKIYFVNAEAVAGKFLPSILPGAPGVRYNLLNNNLFH